MIVVKLGGSLAKSGQLRAALDAVARRYRGRTAVLVPGGGAFADQVRAAQRQWQFDDVTAHAMALLAMQQMARLFNGLKPDFEVTGSVVEIILRVRSADGATLIWSPDIDELNRAGIAASWDITSDSLAAWLALQISARELVLVKSAAIDPQLNLAQLADAGVIDPAFCAQVDGAGLLINIIDAERFNGGY